MVTFTQMGRMLPKPSRLMDWFRKHSWTQAGQGSHSLGRRDGWGSHLVGLEGAQKSSWGRAPRLWGEGLA